MAEEHCQEDCRRSPGVDLDLASVPDLAPVLASSADSRRRSIACMRHSRRMERRGRSDRAGRAAVAGSTERTVRQDRRRVAEVVQLQLETLGLRSVVEAVESLRFHSRRHNLHKPRTRHRWEVVLEEHRSRLDLPEDHHHTSSVDDRRARQSHRDAMVHWP